MNLRDLWKNLTDQYGNLLTHWPPLDHKDRLQYYEDGYALYRSQHKEVLSRRAGDGGYEPPNYRLYVTTNVCKPITDLLVRRAYGEGIGFTAPQTLIGTQAFLDGLEEHEKFVTLLPMVARGASYRGDAVLKVWFDAVTGRVRVTSVHPGIYYPEADPLDETRVIAANISQVLAVPNPLSPTNASYYLWTERHELRDGQGWIVNRLWKLHEFTSTGGYTYDPLKDELPLDAIPQTAPLAATPEYPTGIDDLLVVHIRNRETEEGQPWGRTWGLSDYEDLVSVQAAINDNRSGQRDVLRKMVNPLISGPDITDESGVADLEEFNYFEADSDSSGNAASAFSIATWDVNTQGVQAELDQLLDAAALVELVDKSAMKTPDTGGPISGKAIKASQFLTQGSSQDKQAAHTAPYQRVASIATKLAALKLAAGELDWVPPEVTADSPEGAIADLVPCELEDITIAWRDGVPEDRMDLITEEVELVAGGLQSKIRAIMEVHGVPRSEAEAILAEIEAETPDPLPAFGGFEQQNDDAKAEVEE